MKTIRAHLMLFMDPDIFGFTGQMVRAGTSVMSKKHALANHKCISSYYPKKTTYASFIWTHKICMDGMAMSESLPVADFFRIQLVDKELLSPKELLQKRRVKNVVLNLMSKSKNIL
ncbi:hypothetical protein CHS0354_002180 [Potamilus streckersoni]|uniref:Uncharacterized protein n=1 Tax=Potamilus streckersoni TaxID=2493646 RepID=A0AAE0VHM2_9BIVA|nr:hypothetical protein CHS0354_002180 [Potamilus streckersoni]